MQRLNESEMKLSGSRLEEFKNELITKIKTKYYELWNVERNIEIQRQNIEQLKELSNSLIWLYQVKKVNQSDLILVQSEISRSEVELINLQRNKFSLFKELNFLIGRENLDKEIETPVMINFPQINFSESQFDSLILSLNPELKSMQLMVEMNENEIRANKKELIPDLMISGMLMRMPKGMIVTTKTPPAMIDGSGKEEIMFGLIASINLPFVPWSKKKIDYKIDELNNMIKSIEFEKMNMFQQMRKEVQNLILAINSNKDLIRLYEEKVLPSYYDIYKSQLIELETGKISINNIIETTRMQLMEKMKYYMAIKEYLLAFTELEKTIGINLKKEN
jgi:outer membrane protein TolC